MNIHHHKLTHALTQYDARQAKGKRYNPYALGHYLTRIDAVTKDIEAGAPVRAALVAGFSGRVLDVALKAAGLPISTRDEQMGSGVYCPVAYVEPEETF